MVVVRGGREVAWRHGADDRRVARRRRIKPAKDKRCGAGAEQLGDDEARCIGGSNASESVRGAARQRHRGVGK